MVQQFNYATEGDGKFNIIDGVLIGYSGNDTDVWVKRDFRNCVQSWSDYF